MKPILFIVGVIMVITIGGFAFSYIEQSNERNNELMEASELEDHVLGMMSSSEVKRQEAITILSKENRSLEEQAKAAKLVEESITDARKAVDAQPDNARTWYYLSEAYQQLRNVNPTAAELEKDALDHAIELAPESPELYNNRATVFIFQEKYAEAEKDLLTALQLNPRSANYYFKLGNVYKEMAQIDVARKFYEQAKELTPEDSQINNAQIEYQLQELEKKEQ